MMFAPPINAGPTGQPIMYKYDGGEVPKSSTQNFMQNAPEKKPTPYNMPPPPQPINTFSMPFKPQPQFSTPPPPIASSQPQAAQQNPFGGAWKPEGNQNSQRKY